MAQFEDVRRAALGLPQVEEGLHRGGAAFRVGGKTFALWWVEGQRTIMKLDRTHQHFFFEVRPEVFQPCKVGTGVWSFVDLEPLADDEVADLVKDAWACVAPRRLAKALAPKTPPLALP